MTSLSVDNRVVTLRGSTDIDYASRAFLHRPKAAAFFHN